MENRVKILIADGNEEFCDHVKRRLEQVPGYEIVGTAAFFCLLVKMLFRTEIVQQIFTHLLSHSAAEYDILSSESFARGTPRVYHSIWSGG